MSLKKTVKKETLYWLWKLCTAFTTQMKAPNLNSRVLICPDAMLFLVNPDRSNQLCLYVSLLADEIHLKTCASFTTSIKLNPKLPPYNNMIFFQI